LGGGVGTKGLRDHDTFVTCGEMGRAGTRARTGPGREGSAHEMCKGVLARGHTRAPEWMEGKSALVRRYDAGGANAKARGFEQERRTPSFSEPFPKRPSRRRRKKVDSSTIAAEDLSIQETRVKRGSSSRRADHVPEKKSACRPPRRNRVKKKAQLSQRKGKEQKWVSNVKSCSLLDAGGAITMQKTDARGGVVKGENRYPRGTS